MGICCCLSSLWMGGPLTSSATSVSCHYSTQLLPHNHLPNWPVPCYCLHEYYITMVITLADTCAHKTRPVAEDALHRPLKLTCNTNSFCQTNCIYSWVKCNIYTHLCLWSVQLPSGLACWLTTQASPSKTLSPSLCCSMPSGKLFTVYLNRLVVKQFLSCALTLFVTAHSDMEGLQLHLHSRSHWSLLFSNNLLLVM